jgi:hypothetical protein
MRGRSRLVIADVPAVGVEGPVPVVALLRGSLGGPCGGDRERVYVEREVPGDERDPARVVGFELLGDVRVVRGARRALVVEEPASRTVFAIGLVP